MCLATTRSYGDTERAETYDAAILLRRVVARSLLRDAARVGRTYGSPRPGR